jgi:hypothetical protein
MIKIQVLCQDGQQRHADLFDTKAEASHWAYWGHVCAAHHDYVEVEVEDAPAPSPRKYNLGDTIPDHGEVIGMSSTAYLVGIRHGDGYIERRWVPFYGAHGVDTPAKVEGLVTFEDGSRYRGEG